MLNLNSSLQLLTPCLCNRKATLSLSRFARQNWRKERNKGNNCLGQQHHSQQASELNSIVVAGAPVVPAALGACQFALRLSPLVLSVVVVVVVDVVAFYTIEFAYLNLDITKQLQAT